MMKYILPYIVSISFLLAGCAEKDNTAENNEVKTIRINVKDCEKDMDISDMFDTSFFRIIPLETTPECLIGGEIRQIFYRDGRVYVVEKMAKGVFVFDDNGKFISKIQSLGQGPEEYLNIKAVSITDDKILILDDFGRKVLIYDLNCNYLGKLSLRSKFPAHDMFAIGDRIYFVSRLEEIKDGHGPYRLCSLDIEGQNMQKYIPFDTATVWPGYTNDNGVYTDISGNVKLMYIHTDTIYNVCSDGVWAEYAVDFGDNALPEYFRKNMREAGNPENRKKYIRGIERIFDMKDKMVLYFSYGVLPMLDIKKLGEELSKDFEKTRTRLLTERPTLDYFVFYDKRTGDTKITNGLSVAYFGRYRVSVNYYDFPYVIFPAMAGTLPQSYIDRIIDIPQNPGYERKYKEVLSGAKDGDNPIIFVYKFKD